LGGKLHLKLNICGKPIANKYRVLAINMNFIFASIFLDDLTGQIFSILILTVAAAESAIGLALLIIYYRIRGGVSINLISLLKA